MAPQSPAETHHELTRDSAQPRAVASAWHRLELVLGQDRTTLLGGSVMVMLATIVYWRSALWPVLVWGVIAAAVTLARVELSRRYKAARGPDEPGRWILGHCLGTWAFGALWGAATGVLFLDIDAMTRIVVLMVQSGFFTISAVRNSPILPAMLGTNLLTLSPLLVICLWTPEWQVFAPFILLNLLLTSLVAHHFGAQTLRFLAADQEKGRLLAEVRSANTRLTTIALTDSLTGLTNRRGFDAALGAEWRRAQRAASPLSLLLVDADFFKAFNDRAGHQAGDAALRSIAQALTEACRRPGDLAARYGGEELCLILPSTPAEGAVLIAERLRRSIEARACPHPTSPFRVLTVSIGCATCIPDADPAHTEEALLRAADDALYAAKSAGRNRVVAAPAT